MTQVVNSMFREGSSRRIPCTHLQEFVPHCLGHYFIRPPAPLPCRPEFSTLVSSRPFFARSGSVLTLALPLPPRSGAHGPRTQPDATPSFPPASGNAPTPLTSLSPVQRSTALRGLLTLLLQLVNTPFFDQHHLCGPHAGALRLLVFLLSLSYFWFILPHGEPSRPGVVHS